ncbi:hypothetical protein CesoFtcFv8_006677 [Champsocephalus esox]|uniref:Uncharacterized protein n=1 Tax=Champsocephalus esox TaxID=159716 RepID=A0AAN8CMV0_9TELE|nr:hypothetical protein CesoFtcFv8_006677 [Champsocephalus esox]
MRSTSGPYLQSVGLPLGEFVGCGAPAADSPQVGEAEVLQVLRQSLSWPRLDAADRPVCSARATVHSSTSAQLLSKKSPKTNWSVANFSASFKHVSVFEPSESYKCLSSN